MMRIDIAAEHLGGVGDRFAPPQLQIVHAEEERVPAELGHARLEGDAGARAGMLEDHAERFAGQIGMGLAAFVHPLELGGGFQHLGDFVRRQIGVVDQTAAAHAGAQ